MAHNFIRTLITPEFAAQKLEQQTGNRTINKNNVRRIARDISEGRWMLNPSDPILFGMDGKLRNGQHRFSAIIEANKAVEVYAVYGVSDEIMSVTDTGTKRSVTDILNIKGVSISSNYVATANSMVEWNGYASTRMSVQELEAYIAKHRNALDFVLTRFFGKHVPPGVRKAPVMAPIVRAWYTASHKRLEAFINVLVSGQYNGSEDEAALKLREYLLRKVESRDGGSQRSDRYFKTEYALSLFLANNPIGNLIAAKEELFPVPGDPSLN